MTIDLINRPRFRVQADTSRPGAVPRYVDTSGAYRGAHRVSALRGFVRSVVRWFDLSDHHITMGRHHTGAMTVADLLARSV